MEQHPVPQNITGFQFKLIGDMTITQFIYLAAGIIGGYLSTLLPWTGIIKYPLAATLALIGFALAFMPIEERPLDRWFIAFIKAVYSPTQFLWKKIPPTLDWLTLSQVVLPPSPPKEEPKKPETKLKEYLKTLPPSPAKGGAPLDQQEELQLQKLDFSIGGTVISQAPPRVIYPEFLEETLPQVRVRKLKTSPISGEVFLPLGERKLPTTEIELPKISFPQEETITPSPRFPSPGIVTTPVRQISQTEEKAHPVVFPKILETTKKEEQPTQELSKEARDELENLKLQNEKLTEQIKSFQEDINSLQQFAVQTTEGKIRLKEMLAKYEEAQKQKERAIDEITLLRKKLEEPQKQAVTPSAAIPQPSPRVKFVAAESARSQGLPTLTQTPNVITGIVTDRQGNILPGVIITVKDKRDNPVRALKTNQVGQFKTGTPITNGTYSIELEKDGYEFDIIAIEVKGEVLPPLEIKAK